MIMEKFAGKFVKIRMENGTEIYGKIGDEDELRVYIDSPIILCKDCEVSHGKRTVAMKSKITYVEVAEHSEIQEHQKNVMFHEYMENGWAFVNYLVSSLLPIIIGFGRF